MPFGTETIMRTLFAALAAIGLIFFSNSGFALHGWAWTSGGNIELTGVIMSVSLGNPHCKLEVDVDGEPARNADKPRAGHAGHCHRYCRPSI
jgi:hypothetical protein